MVKIEGLIACKRLECGNVESIRSNLIHIWNISNLVSHKKLLKFKFSTIFQFRLDWIHGEMHNDTH